MEASFALPAELIDEGPRWEDQFTLLRAFDEDATASASSACAGRRSRRPDARPPPDRVGGPRPLDSYHYRLIYQTFYGMRDVLGPLRADTSTAILPFHYRRLTRAERVVVEALPAVIPGRRSRAARGSPAP